MLNKVKDKVNSVLLNRVIIAVLSAVGGVAATTFPSFSVAFCGG